MIQVMKNVLELKNVVKTIKENTVLEDINLYMESGKVYGLVGRNGSGKTMLIRTMSGLLKPTSGAVLYNSKDLYEKGADSCYIGITLDGVGLYPELTGLENLIQLAKIKKKVGKKEVIKAIERVGLKPEDKRTFRKYSLGMKQRILIAQAIMEEPDLLFLDEPTNGLDEEGVQLVRQIVQEEKERGCLVIIASHNKEDIEILCDKVIHISGGEIIEKQE